MSKSRATRLLLLLCATWIPARASAAAAAPTIHYVHLNETIPREYSKLPHVGKCCGVGEVLTRTEDGGKSCVPLRSIASPTVAAFSPLFCDFNVTGLLAPGNEKDRFVAVIGDPCRHNKYILTPEISSEDEYYVLLNGSIFAPRHLPSMLAMGVEYCMEVIPDQGLRVLVCFPEETIEMADSRITFYATGLLISVPFLVATIVLFSLTPRLMDVHGKALCHYCGCLAIAFIALAIVQLASNHLSDHACTSIAFVIQFAFVASFFWLNVMCIETWLQVRRHVSGSDERTQMNRLFFYYSIWAWGPAAILVFISMLMDLNPAVPTSYVKPNFGTASCWFKSDEAAMPYFYAPVGFLVLINTALFTMTAIHISRYQRVLDVRRLAMSQEAVRQDLSLFRRIKRTFFVCLILFFLMGINWVMEFISWWAGGDPHSWSAFDLINALQGVLVFGLFVLRKPARHYVYHRIQTLRGFDVEEPVIGSMDVSLLPVLNDSLPRQRQ